MQSGHEHDLALDLAALATTVGDRSTRIVDEHVQAEL
jgi:hypothetical protein